MSRHLSAANTVESKPWASAERAGRRSSVTATRVNERTDTGFRPPQGVWNGVTHISTERPNPARASRRRPGCVSEPQSLGIGIAGISIGFSVMDDLASAPRPVSARSPCLPCVFTSPKGTSRDAHTSPPSSVVTCSARNVPAGTVTDSQPTTWAPPHFPAQSKRSEEHTSELQSRYVISYAVFCLKKKKERGELELLDGVWEGGIGGAEEEWR